MSVDDHPEGGSGDAEETTDNELEYEDVENPTKAAAEALEDAAEEIEAAGDGVSSYAAEANAIDTFARRIGELIGVHGLAEHETSPLAGSLAEETLSTKTDIKNAIEEHAEGFAKGGDGIDAPINAYLENHVVEIDAVRSTDAKSSTLYRWHFEHDGKGEWYIETGEDAISHYKPFFLRTAIFDAVGVWPAEPVEALRGSSEWANWIGPFISERATTIESKGARTVAVEAIANHIGRSAAFPTVEAMVDRHGVRIDDDPEDGDPSEIWVPYSDIAQIAEDHGIKPRALQVEVAARDLTADRLGNSVSESTTVRNEEITYWVFDASIATPQSYDANAQTPTERIDDLMDESEETEDEGAEPGLIASSRDDLEEMGLGDPRDDEDDENGDEGAENNGGEDDE